MEKIINSKKEETPTDQSNVNLFNKEKGIISELIDKLKNINVPSNSGLNNDKMKELLEEIRIKDKLLSNYPVKLSEGEKCLSVIFISADQKIHYPIICKNTDKFSTIENILYDAYPEYIESQNCFLVNGNLINKYKTLDFNKIKNGDIIMLKKIE